jgi:uncharacterized membrane protein
MKEKGPYFIILLIVAAVSFLFIGTDTLYVLLWWLCMLAIGIIFLPLVSRIFSRFFDKGYLFSKTLGIAVLTLTLWLFSSFKILPFYQVTIFALMAVATILIYIVFKGFDDFKSLFKGHGSFRVFIYEEALFLACLVFFAFLKGHSPDSGVERPMDFAFLNNLLHTKFMPPVDMWFAGKPANYYYYGQYVFAFLTKMSGITSSITYNLSIATMFAFSFSLTFSITANMVHFFGKQKVRNVIIAGLISAAVLAFGSNLHTIMYSTVLPTAKSLGIYHDQLGT